MKHLSYLFLGGIISLLASCGSNTETDQSTNEAAFEEIQAIETKHAITIDNGMDTTITVTITPAGEGDEMEYTLQAMTTQVVNLPESNYHVKAVTVFDSVFVDEDFTITDAAQNYNLNLTKEDYIVENITYIVTENPDLYTTSESFTYKGKTYEEVDADVVKGSLLVPEAWDYNLEEEMPEEVTIYGEENSTVKSKVYHASTFIMYLELYELMNSMDTTATATISEEE